LSDDRAAAPDDTTWSESLDAGGTRSRFTSNVLQDDACLPQIAGTRLASAPATLTLIRKDVALMRTTLLRWLYLGVALVWGALAGAVYLPSSTSAPSKETAVVPEVHYVTPAQLTAAAQLGEQRITLTGMTHEGRPFDWSRFAVGRPVVIVFIKQGCPCSVQFEPFFRRLEDAYSGAVRVLGIIDGDCATARRYVETAQVKHPVLADPERTLIGRFKAENGGYVALVRPDGTIAVLWPGLSASMMRDVSQQFALLADVEEQVIDTKDMPAALTTGCPYGS
jgi:peroxiredoxin